MQEVLQKSVPSIWSLEKVIGVIRASSFILIPLFATLGIVAIFYPGFMTYDTIHALKSAREGITDSVWPPMVSYVWRFVDLISLNPSAMHFSQVLLLLASIFYIVYFFTKKVVYAAIVMVVYLCIPAILGTIAAIWKDVLMAAFFLAGFAISISLPKIVSKWVFNFLLLAALFLLFLGICTRHNAIAGAVPLLFYLAFTLCRRYLKNLTSLGLGTFIVGSVLILATFILKVQLDNFSLPDFKRLPNSSAAFIKSIQPYDIAGASICVGRNLFEDIKPNWSLSKIKEEYDPRHISLAGKTLNQMMWKEERIQQIWLTTLIEHPFCFFYHKWQLTKYLISANIGAPFIITLPAIAKNDYGYSLSPSLMRDQIVHYIMNSSELFFVKPWFLYCLALTILAYGLFQRLLTFDYLVILLSGMFYLISLIMFGNAADARLPFYTTTVVLIFIFSALYKWLRNLFTKRLLFS
ncbi:hypothetical protein ACNVED_01240 [Legionella sp. D16C41]|uniref:hypothetical protein n=1 Tax=Legionella sp. D16C41 TaxID=3402688 RepID=UPI003AF71D00